MKADKSARVAFGPRSEDALSTTLPVILGVIKPVRCFFATTLLSITSSINGSDLLQEYRSNQALCPHGLRSLLVFDQFAPKPRLWVASGDAQTDPKVPQSVD